MRMAPLHVLLALLLSLGTCSSEPMTTEDDVTSAVSSGNTFPTAITITDVSATDIEQMMTRMSESSSATNDEFLTISSATHQTNEQQKKTDAWATESTETTTVATVGTETSVSALTSEERETGSGSITWSTSDSSVTADDNRTPYHTYHTVSLGGSQSEATDALQGTEHVTGNTTDDGVTISDVTELNANFSDVTTSQVNTSDVTTSAVTKSHATLSDVSAIHVNASDVTSNKSDVTVSDVTMTSESQTSASPVVQDSGAQYTNTDIIIIVVVTVVGGLIIISALVVVVWKLRLYRNFARYFQSNGHAQEFNMAARASADGKQPIQMESLEVGKPAGDVSQAPDSNFTIELVREPHQHDQPLFSKADDPLAASGSQFHPAADMVEVPLHDGIRNQGFQGENPNGV